MVAAHQQITQDWWRHARSRFELFVSVVVINEARLGAPEAASRRLAFIEGLPILDWNAEIKALVGIYDNRLALPRRARADVLHIAFAVGYHMDYLLTWNCAHIANGELVRRLLDINNEIDRATPIILTPEELLGETGEDK
ncbi:MAG: type II toxin-antitoxin system VapC family toxin [Acidobacteriota bacterium]